MKVYKKLFDNIANAENIFSAWDEFRAGKRHKKDVMEFEQNLEQNLFDLLRDIKNKTYRHGAYESFFIYDPKRRHIHKATVRDRILHHAIFRVFSPVFDPTFISASFSCRTNKGTHRGVLYVRDAIRKVSKNYTKPCYALKCDVQKFFDSVDQDILLKILRKKIKGSDMIWLLEEIVTSYGNSAHERERESFSARSAEKAYPLET